MNFLEKHFFFQRDTFSQPGNIDGKPLLHGWEKVRGTMTFSSAMALSLDKIDLI